MNPIKIVSSFVLFFIFYFLFFISAASAAVTCQPIYGGGETCVVSDVIKIDKKVLNPTTKVFVDNLINLSNPKDPTFGPNEDVVFQIAITNTGNSTIDRISVQDILPQYVDYVAGISLSFDLHDVRPNETRTEKITVRVVSVDKLPAKEGITCVVNQAIVKAPEVAQDNAKFCIEAKKAPVVTKGGISVFPPPKAVTTPPTGPEALALIGLLPTAGIGYFLRKKAILD